MKYIKPIINIRDLVANEAVAAEIGPIISGGDLDYTGDENEPW